MGTLFDVVPVLMKGYKFPCKH